MRVKVLLDFAEGGGKLEYIKTSVPNNNASRNANKSEIKVVDGIVEEEINNGFEVIAMNGINTIGSYEGQLVNEQGYNGYMWGLSGENGQNSVVLTIKGETLGHCGIVFDRVAGQYPHKYIHTYAGETTEYENTSGDPYIIDGLLGANNVEQTLEFTDWERPNYPMCLTFFEYLPSYEVFKDSDVIDINSTIEGTHDITTINYGCIANVGNLEIYDKTNAKGTSLLWNYAKMGYFNLNTFKVKIEMFNGEVAHHIVSQTPYYNNDKTFKASLTDVISTWNDLICEPTAYTSQTTLYDVLFDLLDTYIPRESYNVLQKMATQKIVIGNNNENAEVAQTEVYLNNYLQNIIIPAFSFGEESFSSRLNKICVVAQLYCYYDENNILSFISARPKATQDEIDNRLIVKYGDQFDEIVSTILVANAYDNVIIK